MKTDAAVRVGGSLLVLAFAVGIAGAGELKGTVKATGVRNSADAIVYVDAIPGKTFPPPSKHAEMDQKEMLFVPHVLPVLVGTTVDFRNSDTVLHNVFSPDKCADRFNLGSWPQGQVKSYTFKNPCAATVLCNVHPEMEGFIVTVPTPYFAVTDKAGSYDIKDVPDGSYTVKVWHPKLKETSKKVTVSGATTADFELHR
ncbi:MAG TPA: carboxypeptidase regulatory-like domain-containing protein [Candidatus Saccharimonadales bacterium]|nr:carboxypeptidase regulatory-like domain-containing protein [Candidatus Saccharimonadales bacterium]